MPKRHAFSFFVFRGPQARRRRKKIAAAEVMIFVYNVTGRLVEEYSTITEQTAIAKTSSLTNDHLGSLRINTDANGAVV
jgi:hypothetical protein